MKKTALYFSETKASNPVENNAISIADLERYAQDWLFDGEYRNHSRNTIDGKRDFVQKLLWFHNHRGYAICGTPQLREFLAYITTGHLEPGGRWGNRYLTRQVRPRTVRYYYVYLQGLFRWLVAEGTLPSSPLDRIAAPAARSEQVQAFSTEQLQALLQAARRSHHARRDEAILLFLLDTGVRASELCALRLCDLDLTNRQATVLGKGNKHRTVFFARTASKALWNYLREQERASGDPVFLSDRGGRAGERLTRSGLLQLIERLGKSANIRLTRCSPHTFRHSFALEFLRNGGNVMSLKMLLGHSSLKMTERYIALANADVQNQHRQFSPADRLSR